MSRPDSPSAILSRAADLIRDAARLAIAEPWYPSVGDVRAGRDEEHFVATAATTTTARWIALMSPALAPSLEELLRATASQWDASRTMTEMEEFVFEIAAALVGLSRRDAELMIHSEGSGVDTP